MKEKDEISRNRPAEEGQNNDPDLRDRSAEQPGVNTMSSSKYDDDNQHLTETASDNFRTDDKDKRADPSFDDIDDLKDNTNNPTKKH